MRQLVPFGQAKARTLNFIGKDLDDFWIAVLCRRHRFDDVAGVFRMVVAVVADEFAVVLVDGEKSRFAFWRFDGVQFAVAVSLDLERLEKLPPFVHFERAGLFLFVNDVWR